MARTGPRLPIVERMAYDGRSDQTQPGSRRVIRIVRTDVSAPIIDVTAALNDCRAASWNTAGTAIAFHGWIPVDSPRREIRAGIWSVNIGLDGRPTNNPVSLVRIQNENRAIYNIDWGRPGSLMSYVVYDELDAIWIAVRIFFITFPGTRLTPNGVIARAPSWSRDGRIAYSREDSSGRAFIHVLDRSSSTDIQLIAGSSGNEHEPSWRPDGNGIIFVRDDNLIYFDLLFNNEVLVINDARQPVFSPDGRRIAFVRGGRIWTCDANGSNAQPLTPGPDDRKPSWSRFEL